MAILFALPTIVSAADAEPERGQRVVLVTGSTSGLGFEVARALASQADFVIVHGRNAEHGDELVAEIVSAGKGRALLPG